MENVIDQFRKPTGWFGQLLGRFMNHDHSRLRLWGLSHISFGPDDVILDIGCGGGQGIGELARSSPEGKIYGIDYSKDMVALAQRVNRKLVKNGRVEIKGGNVSALPFSENTFDIAIASESYYFWPGLVDTLKEIRRVLKPGGTLLIVNESYKDELFNKTNQRFTQWAGKLTFHIHTPDETRGVLNQAGFLAIKTDTIPEKNWITFAAVK